MQESLVILWAPLTTLILHLPENDLGAETWLECKFWVHVLAPVFFF